jgi:c-di-AMP phosphodiesterase-like protein
MVIVSSIGEIIWSNDHFHRITNEHDHLFEMHIFDVVPGFELKWLMEGKSECPAEVSIGGKKYSVFGSLVRSYENGSHGLLGTLYWMDVTDYSNIRLEQTLSRPVICIVVLDNYDELMKNSAYPVLSGILDAIRRKNRRVDAQTTAFCAGSSGTLSVIFWGRYMPG